MLFTPFSHSPPLRISVPFSPLLLVLQHWGPLKAFSARPPLPRSRTWLWWRCYLVSANLAASYILHSFADITPVLPARLTEGPVLPRPSFRLSAFLFRWLTPTAAWAEVSLGGSWVGCSAVLPVTWQRWPPSWRRGGASPQVWGLLYLSDGEEGKVVRGWHFGDISDWTGTFR